MSSTVTSEFNKSELEGLSSQINNIIDRYQYEEKLAYFAQIVFEIFGVAAKDVGLGVVAVGATELAGSLSNYYSTVEEDLTDTLNTVNNYIQWLEDNQNYDRLELKVTYQVEPVGADNYYVPISTACIGAHSINPPGWKMIP